MDRNAGVLAEPAGRIPGHGGTQDIGQGLVEPLHDQPHILDDDEAVDPLAREHRLDTGSVQSIDRWRDLRIKNVA